MSQHRLNREHPRRRFSYVSEAQGEPPSSTLSAAQECSQLLNKRLREIRNERVRKTEGSFIREFLHSLGLAIVDTNSVPEPKIFARHQSDLSILFPR